MIDSAETSRSPNLRDFLRLRSKMSLMFLICYSSPTSVVNDFSHSSFCIEGRRNCTSVSWTPRGVGTGPSDVDLCLPGMLLMCLDASRRNPNVLRLVTKTKTDRVNIAAGERLTSPPPPRKEEMKTAEIISVGTVIVPEKVDAMSILRRTIARYVFRPTTLERANAR